MLGTPKWCLRWSVECRPLALRPLKDEDALAAFESALAHNPMDASAQSGIARVHFILRGDFAGAAVAYLDATEKFTEHLARFCEDLTWEGVSE